MKKEMGCRKETLIMRDTHKIRELSKEMMLICLLSTLIFKWRKNSKREVMIKKKLKAKTIVSFINHNKQKSLSLQPEREGKLISYLKKKFLDLLMRNTN
jgi:hypothetical protein